MENKKVSRAPDTRIFSHSLILYAPLLFLYVGALIAVGNRTLYTLYAAFAESAQQLLQISVYVYDLQRRETFKCDNSNAAASNPQTLC